MPTLTLDERLSRIESALAGADTPVDLRWPPPRRPEPPVDLLAALPDPAMAVDADGQTAVWTPAAAERFGWPAAAVIGGPPPLVPADELSAFHQLLAQARTGVRVRDALLTVVDSHGVRVPAGVSAGSDGSGLVVFVFRPSATEDPPTADAVTDPASAAAIREVAAVLADIDGTADWILSQLPTWEPAREAAGLIRQAARRAVGLADRALVPPPQTLPDAGAALLVDDDEEHRELTRAALAGIGYRVTEAVSGDEAWRIAKMIRGPLPLLVADLALSGLGGRMLADWLRAVRPGLRAVFLCHYPPPGDELPPGMTVLTKPFRAEQLLAAVRRVRAAVV